MPPGVLDPRPLPKSFYAGDPLDVARGLLGALLLRDHPERGRMAGRIVEVEAYRGEEDLACHAAAGPTPRASTLYGPPGVAYIYLIYGMHHMLNAVAWPDGMPAAVLIRAIEPLSGLDRPTNGPGRLCRALGIDRSLNRTDLGQPPLWIAAGPPVPDSAVERTPRIGVDYAGEWAAKPWRFAVRENVHVSRFRGGAPSRPRRRSKG